MVVQEGNKSNRSVRSKIKSNDSIMSDSTSNTTNKSDKKHRLKQRFEVIKKLGQGTYGKVQLAINKETGQEVCFIFVCFIFVCLFSFIYYNLKINFQ